ECKTLKFPISRANGRRISIWPLIGRCPPHNSAIGLGTTRYCDWSPVLLRSSEPGAVFPVLKPSRMAILTDGSECKPNSKTKTTRVSSFWVSVHAQMCWNPKNYERAWQRMSLESSSEGAAADGSKGRINWIYHGTRRAAQLDGAIESC